MSEYTLKDKGSTVELRHGDTVVSRYAIEDRESAKIDCDAYNERGTHLLEEVDDGGEAA